MDRRAFLAACSALPLATALPRPAMARMQIGAATLTTISDGNLVLPGSFVFDPMPQAELTDILQKQGVSRDRLTPECNLSLYQDGTNTVLFDVGSGPDFQPSAGRLPDTLAAAGLAPEDVTHVVITHAHPDHIWGLLDEFDDPFFADATYLMGRAEWDYWWNPETVNTIGDARAAFAVGARRRMEVIEDTVELIDDGQEILPGIQAVLTAGHTPGHMAFELRSGSTAAMILGDAISNHHVAFAKPEWPNGSDQDATRAAETRRMLFERITTDDVTIAGFHLPDGGLGRVERADDAYRYIAGAV